MFTGLVQATGRLLGTRRVGSGIHVRIGSSLPTGQVAIGDSVAVNGICLTVVELESGGSFQATAGRETVERTTLSGWRVGRRLNLELALRLGDRLGGHIVQGHVDGVVRVDSIERQEESVVLWVGLPRHLARYVVEKGSVALDGVSLTVNAVEPARFRVNVIPHTWTATCLSDLSPGDLLNLEVDVLARYVERLLGTGEHAGATGESGLSLDKLRENGFA